MLDNQLCTRSVSELDLSTSEQQVKSVAGTVITACFSDPSYNEIYVHYLSKVCLSQPARFYAAHRLCSCSWALLQSNMWNWRMPQDIHKLPVILETYLQMVLELENESFTDPVESDTELDGVSPGFSTNETHFSLKRNTVLFLLKTKKKRLSFTSNCRWACFWLDKFHPN